MASLPGLPDLTKLVAAQLEMLATLPATVASLNKTLRNLADSVATSRDSFLALQRLAVRADALLDDVEPPLRALLPHLERLVGTLDNPDFDAAVRSVRETEQRIASIAASTERITSLIDEAGGRILGLPGASLIPRALRGVQEPRRSFEPGKPQR